MAEQYAAVVGGVNMDIVGRSFDPLILGDSNPGTVTVSMGGVGRNIAHNLRLMGTPVRFFTALGDDAFARRILDTCQALEIDVTGVKTIPGGATPVYLSLNDPDGNMAAALSDMSVCSRITPDYLEEHLHALQGAGAVAVDANIPAESLLWLASACDKPIFADPVSTKKAEKLRPILGKLHTLKPNRLEAEALSGLSITDERSLQKAAKALLDTGLRRVFISLGADGVLAADHRQMIRLSCAQAEAVNTNGAGDAFMAGLIHAYLHGRTLMESAVFASAAAAVAVESRETISPGLSAESVKRRARESPPAVYPL